MTAVLWHNKMLLLLLCWLILLLYAYFTCNIVSINFFTKILQEDKSHMLNVQYFNETFYIDLLIMWLLLIEQKMDMESILRTWRSANRVYAMTLYPSVCHKLVLYQTGWMDQASFFAEERFSCV